MFIYRKLNYCDKLTERAFLTIYLSVFKLWVNCLKGVYKLFYSYLQK